MLFPTNMLMRNPRLLCGVVSPGAKVLPSYRHANHSVIDYKYRMHKFRCIPVVYCCSVHRVVEVVVTKGR